MLDIVAADKNQPAAPIDCGGIDHGEAGHPSAGGVGAKPVATEPAHQPGREADQCQHEHEGKNESDRLLHPKIPRQTAAGSARASDAHRFCNRCKPDHAGIAPRLLTPPAEAADG
jgi:hypothetical protein